MKGYIPKVGERVPRSAEFVPACDKLLDVGCGDGIAVNFLKVKANKIYGIDNSPKNLNKASNRGLITELVDLDSEKFPFKANFFDVVICLDVIEHVRDPKGLLEEVYRVLKKNGTLVISTPNIRFTNHLVDLVVHGRFPKTSTDTKLYDGGHIHFFTYKDLVELLKEVKYSIEAIEGVINKYRRGWKGRFFEFIFGKKVMLEFRAPGILIVAKKTL